MWEKEEKERETEREGGEGQGRTHYKQLHAGVFPCCSAGLLGFHDDLDLLVRHPGLQLFRVLLSLDLAVGTPLLRRAEPQRGQTQHHH